VRTQKSYKRVFLAGLALTVLLVLPGAAVAQSPDQNLPTAVLTNEISGTIRALDIGDPRLTRHFYAFEGIHGDLFVTVESQNLNGDLDIFTAVTFRPLMKISMFASASASQATKSIYLRRPEVLILRIEARSPNDEDGTYHVRFHGAFAPFSGGIPVAENTAPSSESAKSETRKSTGKNTRRVSSVGARVEEPRPQVAAAPAGSEEKPAATEKPKVESTAVSRAKNPPASSKEGAEKTGIPSAVKPAAAPQQESPTAPPSGPHLIIEEKDGTRVDRPMVTVRRVIIENGVIVIVLKNGRIQRVSMSTVARMAIEP
jgi:hypothetical protein